MRLIRLMFLFILLAVATSGCGTKLKSVWSGITGVSVFTGLVQAGPVMNATVTIYAVNSDGSRGSVIGTTSSNSSGVFNLNIPSNSGPVLAVATGGSYVEEASGQTVQVGTTEILALISDSSASRDIVITPLTHAVAKGAIAKLSANPATSIADAASASHTAVASALGITTISDFTSVFPANPGSSLSSQGYSSSDPEAEYLLALAAISQLAENSVSATDSSLDFMSTLATNVSSSVTGQGSTDLDTFATSYTTAQSQYSSDPTSPFYTSLSASVASAAGATAVGSTKTVTVTITNSNSSSGPANAISLSGLASPFTVQSSTCSGSLAAGSSCQITLLYSPIAVGTHTGSPTVVYTAAGANYTTSALSLSETSYGVASLSASVSSPAGTTAAAATKDITVTVTNSNSATSAASSLSLSGLSSPFAQQSTTCGSTIAIGASCTYTIRFTSPGAGTYSQTATLTYATGSGSNATTTWNLSEVGTGVSSVTLLVDSNNDDTDDYAAGTTAAASTRDITIKVKNSSSSTSPASGITLGALAMSGAASANYSVQSTTCGSSIAIGASCNFVVRFTSPGQGTWNATATLTYDPGSGSTTTATKALAEIGTGTASVTLLVDANSDGTDDYAAGSTAYLSTRDITIKAKNSTSATAAAEDLNAGGALALSGSGSSHYSVQSTTCGATLAIGATCNFVVRFTSPGSGTFSAIATLTYDPSNGSSATATKALAEVGTPVAITVGAGINDSGVTWSNGAKWNDYLFVTSGGPAGAIGSNIYALDNVACNPAGGHQEYWKCIHAGEFRTATLTGTSSCSSLTFSDSLGAFNWSCAVVSGTARIRSLGLKAGKGLRDLIDSSGWKSNQLTVNDGTRDIYQSTANTAWWSNAVDTSTLVTTAGTAPIYLNTASTIYVATNDVSMNTATNIEIVADKVALVTLGSNTITFFHSGAAGTSQYRVNIDAEYVWIESYLRDKSSVQANSMILGNYHYHTRIHNTRVNGGTSSGSVTVTGTGIREVNGRMTNVAIAGSDSHAISGGTSAINGLNISEARAYALYGLDDNSTITNFTISSSGHFGNAGGTSTTYGPIDTSGHSYLTFAFGTVVNNIGSGIYVNSGGSQTISQLLSANNGSAGIRIRAATSVKVANVALSLNGSEGVVQHSNSQTVFSGRLLAGGNGRSDCRYFQGASGLHGVDSNCANQGTSNATYTGTVNVTSTFVGKVTVDSQNPDHSSGTMNWTESMDLLTFENFYRSWGRDGSSFNATNNQGSCGTESGACRIWDFRVSAADSVIYGLNGSFTASAACPAAVDGTVYISDGLGRQYLLNAIEMPGYGGNNDGLCENYETCVYQPHIGAYAGEGTPTQTCTFNNGTITGVTMYVYPTLGI